MALVGLLLGIAYVSRVIVRHLVPALKVTLPSSDPSKDVRIKQLELDANVRPTHVVNVQVPCKLTAEQINPTRLPQACPGAPPPTQRDRILAINAHLTEGDRNRFSNALSEFDESLNQGDSIFYKISDEGNRLVQDRQSGAITKNVQSHLKTLTALAADGWRYQKAFPVTRNKWDMFREQTEYIFGDNPDNLGPNSLINAADGYKNYLEWWNVIQNKEQQPIINLLTVQQNEFQNRMNGFGKWRSECRNRITEMRKSIR